jgi:capsular polysaccharide transport system permease protein
VKIFKNLRFISIFIIPFILSSIYILYFESELFKSSSTILIKDLKSPQVDSNIFGNIFANGSSNMRDSKLMEKYIYSSEMFRLVDREFNLTKHYMSRDLDFLQRKYSFSRADSFYKLYQDRLTVTYDELSTTLDIAFLHTNPKIAKDILEFIIQEAENKLNRFNKENGKELLKFLREQVKKSREILFKSIERLLEYQNRYRMIDPSIDIKSKSRIIAGLEKQIIEKEIEYSNLVKYMNRNSVEVKSLKSQIENLKQKLNSIKDNLSGSSKRELNRNLFEFERLKSDVEFNRERYKQTLIQLDLALIEATQNAKNSITVVEPTLPDSYDKPDKLKSIFTLFILLFLSYGIISMIYAIIRDHRD